MPAFWRFAAMSVICVNLKAAFRHLDATLPKYQLRAFGCAARVGAVYAINPATIVLLVPIVGALTTRRSHFSMIHAGAWVSALSPLWLAAFGTEWAAALFVLTLSLGEAVWSPRWYDYSMGVAPLGREGAFTALASAPLFLATLPTGLVSGWLLSRFCPEDGQCLDTGGGAPTAAPAPAPAPAATAHCDGAALWGVVALLTLASPVLIALTQRWVRPSAEDAARAAGAAPHADLEPAFDVSASDPVETLEHADPALPRVRVTRL
jgi:hypothetical protein